jgi:hypothetical protein
MSYADILAEKRRLYILRILQKTPGLHAGHQVLRTALADKQRQWPLSAIREDLQILAVAGCVELEELSVEGMPSVLMATLTEKGSEVASGLESVPGVARLEAGE